MLSAVKAITIVLFLVTFCSTVYIMSVGVDLHNTASDESDDTAARQVVNLDTLARPPTITLTQQTPPPTTPAPTRPPAKPAERTASAADAPTRPPAKPPRTMTTKKRNRVSRDIEQDYWATRRTGDPWQKDMFVKLADVDQYGPYPHRINRDECGILCESVAQCAAAVWIPQSFCFLRRFSPFFLKSPAKDNFLYVKGAEAAYADIAKRLLNISGVFAPLAVEAATLVVTVRCRQNLWWLAAFLRRVASDSPRSAVQAVVYERCDIPAEEQETLEGGFRVLHQEMPPYYSTSLTVIAHLLVNRASYTAGGGGLERTFLVDPDLEEHHVFETRAGLHMNTIIEQIQWIDWSFPQYVDFLVTSPRPLLAGSGVQLVRPLPAAAEPPPAVAGDLLERLEVYGRVLSRSKMHAEDFGPQGLVQCPSMARPPPLGPPGRRRVAIVTYLSDDGFLVCARVLIHSLQKLGSTAEIVVALLKKSANLREKLLAEFPTLRIVVWPDLSPPPNSKTQPRWQDNWSKLNLFSMAEYQAILYVDADMVALQNPDSLFDHKAVRSARTPFLAFADWGRWNQPPSTKLNGGVLFLRPHPGLFECIKGVLYSTNPMRYAHLEAEQGYLRYFFGDTGTHMPYTFNLQKTVMWTMPELWKEDKLVLLHYVGQKPHKTWSDHEWLVHYRSQEERQRLMMQDQIDDERPDFHKLAFQWRSFFFSLARFAELLSIFILYEDKRSHQMARKFVAEADDRELFVPLSLRDPALDANGLSVKTFLTDSDLPRFDDVAALSAVANDQKYTKPWIGFTDSLAKFRAVDWPGASIDWVRAEAALKGGAAARRILFWFGRYASDYWDMMNQYRPGMQSVMRQVLRRMGYSDADLVMPANRFWSFGHYMLLPHKLLQEYVAFLKKFLDAFVDAIGITCPFSLREGATSCESEIAEWLLNFWATKTDCTLDYVVDDENMRYTVGCQVYNVHCKAKRDSAEGQKQAANA